jgi:hypothetical protein
MITETEYDHLWIFIESAVESEQAEPGAPFNDETEARLALVRRKLNTMFGLPEDYFPGSA